MDVTLHQTCNDGSFKAISKASGGPWGGCVVDNNFIKWMIKLFGNEAMEKFRSNEMDDYFHFLREFEIKKRSILSTTEKITIGIPASLTCCQKECGTKTVSQALEDLSLTAHVTFIPKANKLRVDASVAREWLMGPINDTIRHLSTLDLQGVNTILIVGGFGDCQLLQDSIKKQFPDKHVIVPDEASLAVLKGAVRFGYMSA